MFILQLIAVQTVIFLVVFFLLRRMLLQNTTSAVNRLKLTDEENVTRLAEVKKKIEELEAEHQQKKGELPQELEKEREGAKRRIEEEKNRILSEAREEARRILEAGQSRKNKVEQEMEKGLQSRAVELAGKIVRELLSDTLKSGLNERLVDEFLREIEALEMGHVPVSIQEVEVALPQPLHGDQMERLKDLLKKKLGRPIGFRETIRKEMSGGIIVHVGSLVVDGSLENLIQGVARRLKT